MYIKKGIAMKDLLLPIGILVVWFILFAWVLPKFGFKT